MGAYRDPGAFNPLAAGLVGSVVTTWVTFVPCFLWIFLGAPYIERLRGNRLLTAALSAITAAVVGVVLNLALWFSLHTLFQTVTTRTAGPLRLHVPDLSTFDPSCGAVALLALVLTFYLRKGMAVTLAASAAVGAVIHYASRAFAA